MTMRIFNGFEVWIEIPAEQALLDLSLSTDRNVHLKKAVTVACFWRSDEEVSQSDTSCLGNHANLFAPPESLISSNILVSS